MPNGFARRGLGDSLSGLCGANINLTATNVTGLNSTLLRDDSFRSLVNKGIRRVNGLCRRCKDLFRRTRRSVNNLLVSVINNPSGITNLFGFDGCGLAT